MQRITTVILDLDNTLFDWVDVWYKSFSAMLEELAKASGVDRDVLIRDFKAVFTHHGTSEYAFAIEELPSLQQKHPDENIAQLYDSAIHAYRSARKAALSLYPDVEETLQQLKDCGCLLIGYTESMAYYTHRRMRKLGLDRILDYIYSPQDHDLPEGMTPEQIRMYPKDEYGLRRSAIRHTPKGELKPNPDILLQIIRDIGASPSETLYIGDSLMKDVAMANSAHVSNAWAKYGQAQNRPEYELLRKVTHWSSSAVEKEKGISEVDVEPTIVLENSLAEIMKPFSFERFTDRSEAEIATVLDAWSKTVDVQMHFNELAMKIRNFALTILGVILAGAAFSIKERTELVIFGTNVPLVSLLLVVGAAVWIAFYLMDRHWYHRLLIGSVRHGIAIENRHSNALPELGLATAIGAASPSQIISWRIHSSTKLDLFYLFGAAMLIVAAVCSFFIATKNNVPSSVAPTPAQSAAIPATTTNDNTQRQQVDEEGKTQPPGNSPNVDDNGQGEKQ